MISAPFRVGTVTSGPQQTLNRRLEFKGTLAYEIRQQNRREHLGDRADLEDGVAVRFPWVIRGKPSVAHDAALPALHDTHHDADAPFLFVDPLHQEFADLRLVRH